MLLCNVVVVIYVLCCDINLATGNDNGRYLRDRNRRIIDGESVTLVTQATKTKKKVTANVPKHQARDLNLTYNNRSSTTEAAKVVTNNTDQARRQDSKDTKKNKEPSVLLSPYNIKVQMNKLCENFPNANITIQKLGRTLEYNDIFIMKVTEVATETDNKYLRAQKDKYLDETPPKQIVFIVHGLSTMGRERIPCLSRSRELKKLVSYYFEHLDKFDIFIMPMANPDGSKINTWNKNVAPQNACIGVALDRNFDVAWNVSKNVSSCSHQYPGPLPFSEPETRAIRSVFQRYSHKIVAYFHVHGGTFDQFTFKGDAVLYPKGYSDALTDDDKYIDLRGEIDEAMKNASFRVVSVTVDSLYNWYGQVAGSSVDYASTVYGISYALELVMQPYNSKLSAPALEEIWKVVIDVLFNNIWRSTRTNEIK